MSRSPELERKLAILMSLAADDREGLPPRLRNAGAVGALGPVNIRHLRPAPGMRMSLLRILMTNACSFNCHYCPMRRDREMPRTLLKPEELVRIFLGARRARVVRGALRHHRNSRTAGQGDGRSDHRARAASGTPPLRRLHPRQAGAGRRGSADGTAHPAREPSLDQPGGPLRSEPGPDRAGQELRHNGLRSRTSTGASTAGARSPGSGQAARPPPPGRYVGHDHAVRRWCQLRQRPIHPRHGDPPECRRGHPSRALQRLSTHREHAAGERARGSGTARAPAVSGRLSAPGLRLRLRPRSSTSRPAISRWR